MPKKLRTIEPQDYLNHILEAWDAKNAAAALGCEISDIRDLQRSRKFCEMVIDKTVGIAGPDCFKIGSGLTAIDLVMAQKDESFWQLKLMGKDEEVPPAVRSRIHMKFIEHALNIEGVSQKIQHAHEVIHKLDPESAQAIQGSAQESHRLLNAAIDVEDAEVVDA